MARRSKTQEYLDTLWRTYDRRFLPDDPLVFARRYSDRDDVEVAAFFAAALAYGRVETVRKSVAAALAPLGPRPAAFIRAYAPRRRHPFTGFFHRWTRADDLDRLCRLLRRIYTDHGNLEAFFLQGYREEEPHLEGALTRFVANVARLPEAPPPGTRTAPGAWFFFPSPAGGSPCKRLNMFLRWMIRRDTLDCGLWRPIPPAKLIIPLDVHVARAARRLRLTRRKSDGWRTAVEITDRLRRYDPVDPVKYDFALAHHGMRLLRGTAAPVPAPRRRTA